MAIILRHQKSISGLQAALSTLTAADAAETAARIAGDAANNTSVAAETARATAAEAVLTSDLSAEVTRATAAEATLTADLATEVSRATAAEGILAGDLSAEVTRATSSETALDARLDTLEAGLVSGVIPRGSVPEYANLDALVESTLAHGWGYYITNQNDLMLYVIGSATYDYQPAGWTNGFIKYADYTELSQLVNTEQARAVAAEGVLTTNLANEVSRATAAELAEQTRATAAEAANAAAITQEVSDRIAADTALEASLQAYADAAATAGGGIPLKESLVVASGKVVLAHAPKNGVNGVMNFGTVRYTDTSNIAFDAPLVPDGGDLTGKTFLVSTDVANEWDGNTVAVQYLYTA